MKQTTTGYVLVTCISVCIVFLLILHSCKDYEKEEPVGILIKTPVLALTISEFMEELELKKVSYPYATTKDSSEYNNMVIELVNNLSEEIVLLSEALTEGIDVSKEELDAKASELRRGYIEEQFSNILLEKAIPLEVWRNRLRKNMIIEKLVETEIKDKVEISPSEIVEFYKNYKEEYFDRETLEDPENVNNNNDNQDNTTAKNSREIINRKKKLQDEQELIVLLRLQKTQKIYEEWMQKLENKYPVEINKEKLKSLLKS